MLLVLILTTMPVHALDARYQEPASFWPMAFGSVLFIAAIVFCVVAMKRIVMGDLHKGQEAQVARNKG